MTRIHRSVPRGLAGPAGALGAGALGVVLLAAGVSTPTPGQPGATGTGRDEAGQVLTPGGPIDVGRLGDVRITLDAGQGTWTSNGTEVSLETYRTVPGDVLTYTAQIGVSADEPVLATLRASTASTDPALVTELDIDVDGGTDLGGSTVVAFEGTRTVRVSLGLTFAPTAQGQDLQGAAVDLPEIVVRTQPVGTGVVDGAVGGAGERGRAVDQPGVTLVLGSSIVALVLPPQTGAPHPRLTLTSEGERGGFITSSPAEHVPAPACAGGVRAGVEPVVSWRVPVDGAGGDGEDVV